MCVCAQAYERALQFPLEVCGDFLALFMVICLSVLLSGQSRCVVLGLKGVCVFFFLLSSCAAGRAQRGPTGLCSDSPRHPLVLSLCSVFGCVQAHLLKQCSRMEVCVHACVCADAF